MRQREIEVERETEKERWRERVIVRQREEKEIERETVIGKIKDGLKDSLCKGKSFQKGNIKETSNKEIQTRLIRSHFQNFLQIERKKRKDRKRERKAETDSHDRTKQTQRNRKRMVIYGEKHKIRTSQRHRETDR